MPFDNHMSLPTITLEEDKSKINVAVICISEKITNNIMHQMNYNNRHTLYKYKISCFMLKSYKCERTDWNF